MKDNHLGKFVIVARQIEEEPELVRSIMGQCIILEAKPSFYKEEVEYTAICDQFREVNSVHEHYFEYLVNNKLVLDNNGVVTQRLWQFWPNIKGEDYFITV
jgi:hypothetical protein